MPRIDAALVWGHNNRTFFFHADEYWRFNDELHTVEVDYPRSMSVWSGVGYYIDAAFQNFDRKYMHIDDQTS